MPRQTQRRCQFHRPVQLHTFRLDTLALEIAAGEIGIFGGYPQMRDIRHLFRIILWLRNRQTAAPDAEINRCIQFAIAEFLDHVRADNTDLCGTVRNKGRDVERPHPDDRHMRQIGREFQTAVGLVKKGVFWHDPRLLQERQGIVENPPFRNCKDQWFGHGGRGFTGSQMKGQRVMDILDVEDIAQGMRGQAEHCLRNDAPVTASVIIAQLALMGGPTACGQKIAHWPGKPLEDAMPLRLTGGLHYLYLSGKEPRLGAIYERRITDQDQIDTLIGQVVAEHDADLLPWFDSPPQTNESGRSASFMAGLLWLSGRVGPRFELLELGASAGVNTMMDRYHYDLNGVLAGPDDSPMRIKPEWRGPPPPQAPVEIVSVRGCDQNPIDLTDDETAARLKGYIWPEMPARFERMEASIALAKQDPPDVAKADAADWTEEQLTRPQESGVTRVLMHSIVWQYLPQETKDRITAAMETAGKVVTAKKPLAWMSLETNRKTFSHELVIRYWPGGEEPALLGRAHAHGAWVEWFEG